MLKLFDLVKEPGVYAFVGGAGSGKSTLSTSVRRNHELGHPLGHPSIYSISIDECFIGNSDYRKKLLSDKASDWTQYKDACNQMNWWDWEKVYRMTYDFITSSRNKDSIILLEGAILGPEVIWALCDKIIYVNTPSAERLANLCSRDSHKRSGLELAHRFLITEYSEQIHYRKLLPYAQESGKLIICNNKGELDFSVENQYTLYLPKEV